jgi:hypothetical protein
MDDRASEAGRGVGKCRASSDQSALSVGFLNLLCTLGSLRAAGTGIERVHRFS